MNSSAFGEHSGASADRPLVAGRSLRDVGIREIVIVDPACDQYGDFVIAARAGQVGLHFCADGRSAMRMARRFRADIWLVAHELPDMSGFDLLDMLPNQVLQGDVDPMLSGARISLDRLGEGMRSGIFIVADTYRLEDEQRSLASGIAGYLVRPITLDVIRATRDPVSLGASDSSVVSGSENMSSFDSPFVSFTEN